STLISGDQEGTAHVTATVGALVAGTEVKIAGPGQPFSITLTATPSSVPVGEQSIITATLYDANGFRVSAGHPISFHVASGSIVPEIAQTDANGQAAAVFTAGGELGVALVEAQAGLGLYASVAITVTPGEPYTVTVAAASPQVEAGCYVPITATVTDRLGHLVQDGTFVTFTTTLGQMTATHTAIHNGRALSELHAGPTTGVAHITAMADNGVYGTIDVQIVPGQAARIALVSDPQTVEVGGQTVLTASAWDAFGNPVQDGSVIDLRADRGTLGFLTGPPVSSRLEVPTQDGQARARFFAPLTPGPASITARAGLMATQGITVAVQPGGPAQLTVTAGAIHVLVGMTTTVRARVMDGLGNPVVDGTVVRFAATLGTVSPREVPTTQGIAETTFFAGSESGDATIGVSVGTLFKIVTIRVRDRMYYLPLASHHR
ncbi:MAG: Ig-like domain-containing protein, partial [Anaerolineae bacterium]|nr:Ig-like domain-containing protein [Anaerolineae bacterium]